MINKRILIISTYPIENPIHGGQKRARAIFDFYVNIFNKVKFISIYSPLHFKDIGVNDLLITSKTVIKDMENNPLSSDLVIGEAIYKDESIRRKLEKIIIEYMPDIIQIEQIYPWAGLELILKKLKIKPKIIYSSHNIEHEMKYSMFSESKIIGWEKIVKKIKKLELEIIQSADLVFAVSKNDAVKLRIFGAKKICIIPNGISKINPTKEAIEHWNHFAKLRNIDKLVTFVASAHLPNLTGFIELVGLKLEYIPKDTRIMLAGGISNYLQQELSKLNNVNINFWNNAEPLGYLSEDNLTALIDASYVILLPITSGGGSNLKTAEAILSGKKIVSTDLAFRSFEKYKKLPNIYFANDAESFRKKILLAVNEDMVARTNKEIKLANTVQWKNCFSGLELSLIKLTNKYPYTVFWLLKRTSKLIIKKLLTFLVL